MSSHSSNHSKLYRFLKRRILGAFLILAILVGGIGYLYYSENRLQERKIGLVDTLGRQRMYSQTMAKAASRISLYYHLLESPMSEKEQMGYYRKISEAKSDLSSSRESFAATQESIGKGYYIYKKKQYSLSADAVARIWPVQQKLIPVWGEFDRALEILGKVEMSNALSPETVQALEVINKDDSKLLKGSKDLIEVLISELENERKIQLQQFGILFTLTGICVIWILTDIYRNVVLPLDLFYRKVSVMGITKSTLDMPEGVAPALSEMNIILEGCRDIIGLIETINQKSTFDETLQFIYEAFRKYIPYSYIGIALFDLENPNYLQASYGISDGSFKGIPGRLTGEAVDVRESSLGKVITTHEPRIINDLERYSKDHPPKAYTRIIMEEGIRSSITLPLKIKGKVLGFIFFSSRNKNEYTRQHSEFLETVVNALAISFEKTIFTDELLYSSVLALAKLAEAKDEDTAVHLDRIKDYTALLIDCLKSEGIYSDQLTDAFVKDVIRFSPMHDIGKVGIRDAVLLKPGKLTPEEFRYMQTHTSFGAGVLKEAEENILRTGRSLFTVGSEIAGHHHERWDGSGYPEGLFGEHIPLSARIVAVVDVFDALTTRRPYKEPFSFEAAIEIIEKSIGTHFDPRIGQCFLKHRERFRKKMQSYQELLPESYQ